MQFLILETSNVAADFFYYYEILAKIIVDRVCIDHRGKGLISNANRKL